jgi:serine protease
MKNHSRFAGALALVAAFAVAGCAGNGGVTPSAGSATQPQAHSVLFSDTGWVQKDGVLYHVPHVMVTREAADRTVKRDILLSYGNGPVLVTPTTYLIFWGYTKYHDNNNVKPLLESYVGNMGGSSHNNIYTQYYQIANGGKVFITNPSSQYAGAWEDDTDSVPLRPTDSQVAAEALRGVAHFGYNANASYVVATPHGRSTSGFRTQWCAYHSATTSGGKLVSYTNLPYMPDAGANCGANIISPPSDETGADEGVTIVEGHEYGESVTDPNPPSGWYNNQSGEIGDICAWQNILNDPFGSFSYTSQPMFSNATQSCVHSY